MRKRRGAEKGTPAAADRPGLPWLSDRASTAVSTGFLLLAVLAFVAAGGGGRDQVAHALGGILGEWVLIALVSVAMTLVLRTGRMDLSGAAVAVLGGMIAARLAVRGLPLPLGFLVASAAGAGVGAFNGLVASLSRMASYVVTLGVAAVCQAFVLFTFGPNGISLPEAGDRSAEVAVLVSVLVALAAALAVALTLRLTSPRRRPAGLEELPPIVLVGIFACAGGLSAAAGVLRASSLAYAGPQLNGDLLIAALAAALIGGASLRGGYGNGYGALIASLGMSVLLSALLLASLTAFVISGTLGAVLVLALLWEEARWRGPAP
jgi:ribose transport system permease protein